MGKKRGGLAQTPALSGPPAALGWGGINPEIRLLKVWLLKVMNPAKVKAVSLGPIFS